MYPWPPEELALLTDLYELTMAQAYVQVGKAHETATFSLFVRTYPSHRGYFVACGLEDVVHYLEGGQDERICSAALSMWLV